MPTQKYTIEKPYYPIVYVRGYAMQASEREETFHDTYYGFSATSVEKRQAPPPQYFEADVFEGQLIRLMKMKDYSYADSTNRGETMHANPSRSIWVCRFYDQDYFSGNIRKIVDHAEDLYTLVCRTIPERLKSCGVDLGPNDEEYKVTLIAHSMGGLVCRTLIQNLLPHTYQQDPKRWIHRLVTMGTPHGGIDLGTVPDFLEKAVAATLNPFDSGIFQPANIKEYLKLGNGYEAHSLGDPKDPKSFPVKRCLCLIGSDYRSYNAVKVLTGNFSDGLVKQDRAYVVTGEAPADGKYPLEQTAYWANIHRAHSGYRGIVNSFESYENLHRFLFGNIRAAISLDNIQVKTDQQENVEYFYDIEFLFSIRKTGVYLHRTQQDPCENAMRLKREEIPSSLHLHTGFMNSSMKDREHLENDDEKGFSYFSFKIRVVEHSMKPGFLWDHEYPERAIYNESIELRVGDADPTKPGDELQYRWLSDMDDWTVAPDAQGVYRIPLRDAGSMSAEIVIRTSAWPDPAVTKD